MIISSVDICWEFYFILLAYFDSFFLDFIDTVWFQCVKGKELCDIEHFYEIILVCYSPSLLWWFVTYLFKYKVHEAPWNMSRLFLPPENILFIHYEIDHSLLDLNSIHMFNLTYLNDSRLHGVVPKHVISMGSCVKDKIIGIIRRISIGNLYQSNISTILPHSSNDWLHRWHNSQEISKIPIV